MLLLKRIYPFVDVDDREVTERMAGVLFVMGEKCCIQGYTEEIGPLFLEDGDYEILPLQHEDGNYNDIPYDPIRINHPTQGEIVLGEYPKLKKFKHKKINFGFGMTHRYGKLKVTEKERAITNLYFAVQEIFRQQREEKDPKTVSIA